MIDPRFDAHLNLCKWCDSKVVWVHDAKTGLSFPVDADMDASPETGTLSVYGHAEKLYATQVTTGQAAGMRQAGKVLYAQHSLTCPHAAKWQVDKEYGKATRKMATRRR